MKEKELPHHTCTFSAITHVHLFTHSYAHSHKTQLIENIDFQGILTVCDWSNTETI